MLYVDEFKSLRRKLRRCQRDAIDSIQSYLSSPYKNKSMLVCLPTGAGKTGIIATICQLRKNEPTLVLSPRKAVCEQLLEQIGGQFFEDRGVKLKDPNSAGPVGYAITNGTVIVDTFQKVVKMSELDRSKYLSQFSLVVVDEGHSEPAPVWGQIVRGMNCRKLIITATPYRNDLFQFEIGDHHYCYTFQKAVADHVVLDPKFVNASVSGLSGKVKTWVRRNPSLKCIIKCEEFAEVVSWLHELQKIRVRVVAFHEQFSKVIETDGFVDVPNDIARSNFQVLIHQSKLDEGIDIPTAKLLVLTYAITSGRELVQTTGRVVRVASGTAEVWDCANGSNDRLWRNYREFDAYISNRSDWDHFIQSLNSATLIEAYLAAFPRISYFGQNFRHTFDIENFDADAQLRLPLASVCFMEVKSDFRLPSFADTLLWQLRGKGELAKIFPSQNGVCVILSITFDNSRFLKEELFFQPRIEIIVAKQVKDFLAVFDSRSIDYSNRKELLTQSSVDVKKILLLAARGAKRRTRETHASAVSSSRFRPERISQGGSDLELAVPSQANASYALSIAKVDNLDKRDKRISSYYLGMRSGRVSDQKVRDFSIAKISAWIDDIAGAMSSAKNDVSGLLSTYSLPLTTGVSGNVVSITIDVSELASDIVVRDKQNRAHTILPGFYYEQVKNGNFLISKIPLRVERDSDGHLFLAVKSEYTLETDLVGFSAGSRFVDWLNSRPIKALLDNYASYFDGKYYLVSLPSQTGFDIDATTLGRQMVGLPEFRRDGLTEKGSPTTNGFAANTVFGIIDSLIQPVSQADSMGMREMKGNVAAADIVFCMDMGTEAADFVISSPHNLIYIHAKCGKAKKPASSAGALAEVGSQALKNVELLISKNTALPYGNPTQLENLWPSANARGAIHRLRIFKNDRGISKLRANRMVPLAQEALNVLVDRRASNACQKEIWILAARSFSRQHFAEEMSRGAGAATESLQAFQLITLWNAAARDNDIDIRYYVSD